MPGHRDAPPVTESIGIAVIDSDVVDATHATGRADRSMYEVKRAPREGRPAPA